MNENHFTWTGYQSTESAHRLIIAYLTIDIQKSPEGTMELLEKINAVRSRQIPEWERIGNAYCLRLFPDFAEIEEDFAEKLGKVEQIPIAVFEAAVRSWQQHITS